MKGLGSRIKELRKKSGLTLIDVSKAAGIDTATLSRIENGKMTGTIQSHLALAKVLKVRLPDLYDKALETSSESGACKIEDSSGLFAHSGGSTSELLTHQVLQKKMSPIRMALKSRSITAEEELPLGTERFIYVISGRIGVHMKGEEKALSEGESLYINASIPHHFENKLRIMSICLVISSPASL